MRAAFFAALIALATPAFADTNSDLARASHMLAADWRPFTPPAHGGSAEAAFSRSCDGVLEEMTALNARLPDQMTPDALRAIRTPQGLILVPTDENPATFFLFAAANMPGLTSGLATIRVSNVALGYVDLIDAGGTQIAAQLGTEGGRSILRVFGNENQDPLLFVACAPTTS